MPPASPTKWAQLVQSYMDMRGLSQRALARELAKSPGIISKWLEGSLPEHRSALDFARRTGIPERQVLEAAGLTTTGAADTAAYPEFLTEILDRLTPAELAAVAVTGRELLRLREEKSAYKPDQPRRGRPRKEPRKPPPR